MKSKEPLKKNPKYTVLLCKCGDCRHWEIYEDMETKERHLICLTCRKRFDVTLHVPSSDHLHWVPVEKV